MSNLYYILPNSLIEGKAYNTCWDEVAVIVNLYYLDTLERYFSYLDMIPENISVYIVSSNMEAHTPIIKYINQRKGRKIKLVKKNNRGRDISALLVACREWILSYKIICFVHDKKANAEYLHEDTEIWIESLWGNTLKSSAYIKNVLSVFEENREIGLLVPPAPIGKYRNDWFGNSWYKNFANTKKLAKDLDLSCELSEAVPPVTLGTVFWGRVEALEKLFLKKWTYEDFNEEPLPCDGTISHAVERILSYVVKDAGYETGILMNVQNAEWMLSTLQTYMTLAFEVLKKDIGISSVADVLNFEARKVRLQDFCSSNSVIYLYGAGGVAKKCLRCLSFLGCMPKGILVTSKDLNEAELEGIPVGTWNESEGLDKAGIIIAVNCEIQKDIIHILEEKNFHNYIVY